MLLKIQDIQCRYDSKVVVDGFGFSLEAGRIACLLGPSGCGKTTVLRAIAGFEKIHEGSISLDGRKLSTPALQLPPEERKVGMVFQGYALFPHLTIRDNIGFGLHQMPAEQRRTAVDDLLQLVQLQDYATVYPHQLSGGQQQRVALARALAPNPRLLLLDEPFSNLDTELRRTLSLEVRNILKQRNTTAILVTHDRTEAFNMADEIGVMVAGQLQQWGSAEELYHNPSNALVASFICDGKFVRGEVLDNGRVQTLFGELPARNTDRLAPGTQVRVLVRPWEISLCAPDADLTGTCPATIVQQQFHGAVSITTLQLEDGSQVESSDARFAGHHVDEQLQVCLEEPSLLAFV